MELLLCDEVGEEYMVVIEEIDEMVDEVERSQIIGQQLFDDVDVNDMIDELHREYVFLALDDEVDELVQLEEVRLDEYEYVVI